MLGRLLSLTAVNFPRGPGTRAPGPLQRIHDNAGMDGVMPAPALETGAPRGDAGRLVRLAAVVLALHALALWLVHEARLHAPALVRAPQILSAVWVAPPPQSTPRQAAALSSAASAPPPPAASPPPPALTPLNRPPAPVAPAAVAPAVPAPRAEVLTSANGETPHPGTPATAPAAPSATPASPATALAQSGGAVAPGAVAAGGAGDGAGHARTGQGVELPSVEARYLHNPPLDYPRLSRLRGEQGRVVVNVLIGVDGSVQGVAVNTSSGFERLDQAALSSVQRWRFVPGKKGGVPQTMWYTVSVNFVKD